MKADSAWNMFVFRDGRRTVPGATLTRAAHDALDQLDSCSHGNRVSSLINALLLAGELECALADAGSLEAPKTSHITDNLAEQLVSYEYDETSASQSAFFSPSKLASLLPSNPPGELRISPPEGFAYYALHPLDFADLASQISLKSSLLGIVGIRSIGVTLSALVLAALRRRGAQAERFSVRPFGHPYNRRTEFDVRQTELVKTLNQDGAEFFVVDEGPGMSGSSFLSVGDALTAAGVQPDRVTFLGSRVPDPNSLRATDAGSRWRRFRSCYARQNSRLPQVAKLYIGGGEWRRDVFGDPRDWPASWTQMERLKFLSPDKRQLLKFEGFGRFGQEVHERSCQVASAGFGPMPIEFTDGFSVYPFLRGKALSVTDLTDVMVERIAEYCAFRATEFRTSAPQNVKELETMVRFNVAEEFGYELALEHGSVASVSPVLVDGRMLPHEWLQMPSGVQKVDAASHCDDHFFPGPTDIAWDLAGAIVEWSMPTHAQVQLIDRYRALTGDDVSKRLRMYLLAYAVFRCGYCLMAAEAVRGSGEEHRLITAHDRYRMFVESCLPQSIAA